MDDNKNQEMSVDELLEKLKASLQDDDKAKEPSETVEDDDIKKAVSEAIGTEEEAEKNACETVEAAEEPEPTAVEEAEPVEVEALKAAEEAAAAEEPTADAFATEEASDDTEAPLFGDEEESASANEEGSSIGQISEDDILAAWGIDRNDIQKKAVDAESVAAAEEAYVAPAVAITKLYRIARVEKKEDFRTRKQSETQKKSVDYDRVDYSLIKQALGMEKPAEGTEEFAMFEVDDCASSPKTIDAPKAEFTYQRQREDIVADYEKSCRSSLVKLILAAVFTAVLFVIECLPAFGVNMPDVLNADMYPVIYSMATLQLLLLSAAVSYKEIANGFFSLVKFKVTSGSLLCVLTFVSVACGIVNCVFGAVAPNYHFSAAFLSLVIRAFEYLDVRRENFAFEVASSASSKKHVAVPVIDMDSSAVEGLEDYAGEDGLVLRTEKCAFVENYFSRTGRRGNGDIAANKYLLPAILLVAVASFVTVFIGNGGAANAFGAFNLSFAVAIPVFVLLSASYPLYKAAKKLYHRDSAIIGESAVDEYSGTTMICFDDADAFPSYGVALENLRIYGNGDIETIVEQMGAVFSKLGGPLKNVFALMTTDCPKPYKVKIDGVYDDGIKATVDGKALYVGSAVFMQNCGFKVVDLSNEIGGKYFSTMYLAEDGGLRAKFYIRYTLDGGFESIVKKLARRGISSVILTGDSNINDELLAQFIDISKLPVKVVRRSAFESKPVSDRADSGVVSRGGVGDLVSAVTMCDKLASVIGTMRAVRIASAVICALLVLGASLFAMSGIVASAYVFIYHLFWMVPAWLVAKFNL